MSEEAQQSPPEETRDPQIFFLKKSGARVMTIRVEKGFVMGAKEAIQIAHRLMAFAVQMDPPVALATLKGLEPSEVGAPPEDVPPAMEVDATSVAASERPYPFGLAPEPPRASVRTVNGKRRASSSRRR